jgi:hypothetical protein
VDSDFLEEMRREMTDRAYRSEFLAEFVDAAGAVFLEDDITAALVDDDYGPMPLWGVRYVAGIDFGRRGDYTVVCVLEVSAHGLRLVEMLRVQGLGWARQLEQVGDCLARWGCKRCCPDRTGIGDALCESLTAALIARRIGCEVGEFVFTPSSKPVLIDGLSIALAHRRLRFPSHPVLLSELRNFEIVGTARGRDRMEAARGHDDTVCALALAVHAAAPLLPRAGSGLVGGTGGRRILGSVGNAKETEFSGCWQQQSSPAWGTSGRGSGGSIPRARLGPRLLASVYRCAAGRRAGALAARTMNRA